MPPVTSVTVEVEIFAGLKVRGLGVFYIFAHFNFAVQVVSNARVE